MKSWFVCCCVAALCTADLSAADTLVLAERGHPAECAVAFADEASPAVRYAAEELRTYVRKLTDVDLQFNVPAKRRVVLDDALDDLSPDGFRIVCKGNDILVRGHGARGCIYGVYALLERFGGVGFYSSWCEKVPRLDRLEVPAGTDLAESPAFAMRESFWYDVNTHRTFAAKIRLNGYNHTPNNVPAKLGGDDFRFGGGLPSCHTFYTLCDPKVYFKDHPEYFSLVKGRRLDRNAQLCLTNPDVLEIVTSNVLARIRRDPGAKFYGVSQNDCYNYCECDACRAIDDAEGSHAGTMVRCVNAVAERVEKEFPNVLIETLAYQYTRKPPKKTRLRKNVVPCLCTIECDFANPIATGDYKENVAFRDDIVGWAKQTDQLYVWDYVTDFKHYLCLFPNVDVLQANVRFFRDNHVKELFEQGDYQGYHGHLAELKAWLLAKLMWNPDADVAALLREFTDGYYGAASPYVREDVAELCALYRKSGHPLSIGEEASLPGLPEDFFLRSRIRWNKAIEVTKTDPVSAYNVKAGAAAFDFTVLRRLQLKPEASWTMSERAEAATLATRLLRFAHEEARGYVRFGEWGFNPGYCTDELRRLAGWGVIQPDAAHRPETRMTTLVSSIERSPKNGRLWATWYAGAGRGENHQNYCVLSTSADDGKTWKEVLIADPDGDGPIRSFDPELWIAPDGKLRWTWCERFCAKIDTNPWNGERAEKGRRNPRLGEDAGEPDDRLMMLTLDAESEPAKVTSRPVQIAAGVMMCKPTVLKDGRWLFPVAKWGEAPSSCFSVTTNGVDFAELPGGIVLPKEDRLYDEHQVVEHLDGSWTCLTRTKNSILESVSADGGRTWTARAPQRFRHTSARVFFRKLASGNILLVKHGPLDGDVGRKDLTAYLSTDDGKTWKGGLLLDERDEISYPDGTEQPDGTILLTYDHDRFDAQEVLFCRFTEADVLAGKAVSGKVELRRVVTSRRTP